MSKSTIRASTWSITINNPIAADEENIALARQKGWVVEGQLEKGENGTPHYQLMVKTPQIRFSAIKKQFPRAHIEVARNPTALEQYVHKEETREGELSTSNEMYPSMSKVWEMFYLYTLDLTVDEYGRLRRCPLVIFDAFIRSKIEEGYYLESIGVNPQTRSSVTHYWESILVREERKVTQRQKTDRQTDESSVSSIE